MAAENILWRTHWITAVMEAICPVVHLYIFQEVSKALDSDPSVFMHTQFNLFQLYLSKSEEKKVAT